MEAFIAIFIAVSSFIFTLYQWMITVRLKRPNLKMLYFDLKELRLYKDYDLCKFYLDTKDFIVSNLSDLPNSLVKLNLYCKIGGQWVKAEMHYEQEFERMETRQKYIQGRAGEAGNWDTRNEVVRGKEKVSPFPIVIQPHISMSFSSFDIYGYFRKFPTAQETAQLKIRLEMVDQYGKAHNYYSTRRDFPDLEVENYPHFTGGEIFGRVFHRDSQGKAQSVAYAVYIKDEKQATDSVLKAYYSSGDGYVGERVRVSIGDLKKKIEENPEQQNFEYSDRQAGATIITENKVPTQMEVTLTEDEQTFTEKFSIPQEFRGHFSS